MGYEAYRRVTATAFGAFTAATLVTAGLGLTPVMIEHHEKLAQYEAQLDDLAKDTARHWDQGSGDIKAEASERATLQAAFKKYQQTKIALVEARGVKINILNKQLIRERAEIYELIAGNQHLPEKTLASLAIKYGVVANNQAAFNQFAYFREGKLDGGRPDINKDPLSLAPKKPVFEDSFDGERGVTGFLTGGLLMCVAPLIGGSRTRGYKYPQKKLKDFKPAKN